MKGTKEPGASTSGPSRSDSIMLLRVGGGHNGRLSIARDTVVDIPGHGESKINAAYAYGGAPLAIKTVKQYLGVEVNHVIEVNFDRFPGLIDALGGVTYTGECVVSKINGGNAQRRLHAAPEEGQHAHQRQPGAGAGAHAQEPLPPAGDRPGPRRAPAVPDQRDEGQADELRRACSASPTAPSTGCR